MFLFLIFVFLFLNHIILFGSLFESLIWTFPLAFIIMNLHVFDSSLHLSDFNLVKVISLEGQYVNIVFHY